MSEYDIQTADDIQDTLRDLLGGTIQETMEAEMDEHLGYDKQYLATFEATKKWPLPLRNWSKLYGELSIMYPEVLPE